MTIIELMRISDELFLNRVGTVSYYINRDRSGKAFWSEEIRIPHHRDPRFERDLAAESLFNRHFQNL